MGARAQKPARQWLQRAAVPLSRKARAVSVLIAAMALPAANARAQDDAPPEPIFSLEAEYTFDIVGVAQGSDDGVRHVDLLTVTGDLDLDRATGWRGARLVAQAIAGTGAEPNALAGTLQGINNAEVAHNQVKLYQFYLSQQFSSVPATIEAGFIDLNAQFYANDAAGLLIAPAFGIGSELAATGPNGPAIFPSTALTALVRVDPSPSTYASLAVVNAESGVLGDAGGIPALLNEGALVIGEAGLTRFGKLALGAWAYTKQQDDIRLTDAAGNPLRQAAHGAYVLVELPFGKSGAELDPEAPRSALFVRAGVSDGDTTPYKGGWQAGVLLHRVLPGRAESQLSVGANQAFLTNKFRRNEADAGVARSSRETGLEITLADQVLPWLSVQGDAQYVWNSDQGGGVRDAVILGLRFVITGALAW